MDNDRCLEVDTAEAQLLEPVSFAVTFAYNDDDITRILSQVECESFATAPGAADVVTQKELFELKKQVLSLTLHQSFLAEYIRSKRIPRGYRIGLRLTLLNDDPLFVTRFFEILNKGSLDVMLLTVERLHVKVTGLKKQIAEKEDKIRSTLPEEQFDSLCQEQQEKLEEARQVILQRKQGKIARDAEDYRLGRVYTWKKERRTQRRPQPSPEGGDTPGSGAAGSGGNPRPHRQPRHSQRRPRKPRGQHPQGPAQPDGSGGSTGADYSSASESTDHQQDFQGGQDPTDTGGGSGKGGAGRGVDSAKPRRNPRAPLPRDHYPRRNRGKQGKRS
ncbi:uncharacterized protein [Hyperolius riggenbachi]|uniref:uncharacterized protein n=1 Tax=Hyperolius riggenbachi TaxID=752182 RepID=UPI0035A2845E